MSILGTLEGIGAGDPMGSFMKSNQAAIEQAGNAAAGKGLLALFSSQVPGSTPISGPPVSAGMPPNAAPGPPQVPMGAPPNPTNFGAPAASAVPQQSAAPGATAMPQGPPGPPQGQGGPMPGGPGPVAGAGQGGQQLAQAQAQQQQLKAKLAQLQAQRGGGGQPQPGQPQPGQPPQGPPQGPGMQAPQQQMPPQAQAVIQGVQANAGRLDWRSLVQGVVQANPGASPEVIASAVNKLIPLMTADSLQQWRQVQAQLGAGRLVQGQERIDESATHHQVTEGQGQERIGQAQERIGQGDRRLDQADTREQDTERHRQVTEGQGQQRIDLAKTREGRLDRQGMARNDQRYQELELKRQGLENRFRQTKNGETLREWRQALEVQHQYTRTIIAGSQMSGKDKQKLLKDNDDWRNEQIKKMREGTEGTFDNKFKPAETMPPSLPAQ